MKRSVVFILILVVLLSAIPIGIVTHSAWNTVMVSLGLLAMSNGCWGRFLESKKRKRFMVTSVIGLILIGVDNLA